jgi:type VI secretion system protein ImpA
MFAKLLEAAACRMDEPTEGFNIEALLAPVPGDVPAGTDLRQDYSPQSLYYRLRDARAEARAVERELESPDPDRPPAAWPPPQWRTVRELATEALAHAKDLEIAAWLTEALLRGNGLPGLTAGVKLMSELVERFWDELYPLPDDEGIATRVAPVAGLNGFEGNGTLIQPLRRLALFARPDGAALEFWQYEQSERLAEAADEAARQQRMAAGAIPFETLYNEAVAAGAAHFSALRDAAVAAGDAWRRLGETFDARAAADAPPTSAVRDLIDKIAEIATRFAAGAPAPASAPPPAPGADGAGASATLATGGQGLVPAGAIASREDALRALLDIAEYFRRTEPLSPLAYTLQEAVRRARMNWPQLLEEVVPDPSARAAILTSLGIRPPSE